MKDIRDQLEADMPLKDIARLYGVAKNTFKRRLKVEGLRIVRRLEPTTEATASTNI